MLREQTPHRDLVSEARRLVLMSPRLNVDQLEATRDTVTELDNANEAYIRAKVRWSTTNTDETMIDLIGRWARLNKLFRDIEHKYGSKT